MSDSPSSAARGAVSLRRTGWPNGRPWIRFLVVHTGMRRQRRDARTAERHHTSGSIDREGARGAASGAPAPLSPVVQVVAESRVRFPWLPARVIAGSVWRGPSHERVRVDLGGRAEPVTTPPRRL